MVGPRLSIADQARVSAAITAAEARTTGEIFCILMTHRERYPVTAAFLGAVLGLALPVVLALLGLPVWGLAGDDWASGPTPVFAALEWLLPAQLAAFAVIAGLIWALRLDGPLTPAPFVHARLHALATAQFAARGLTETKDRTGVLIFASPRDRYAEVIADSGIYARVSPDHWRETVRSLTRAARSGDLAGGFVSAIGLAGGVLAEFFPADTHATNELPDRLVEI